MAKCFPTMGVLTGSLISNTSTHSLLIQKRIKRKGKKRKAKHVMPLHRITIKNHIIFVGEGFVFGIFMGLNIDELRDYSQFLITFN